MNRGRSHFREAGPGPARRSSSRLTSRQPSYAAYVRIDFPADLKLRVRKYAIDDVTFGAGVTKVEPDLHLTLKWGLLCEDPDAASRAVETFRPFALTLGRTGWFRVNNHDVLWLAASAPELGSIHDALSALPALRDAFPFRPHVTVCRMRSGTARAFADDRRFEGFSFRVDALSYVVKHDQNHTVSLPLIGPRDADADAATDEGAAA